MDDLERDGRRYRRLRALATSNYTDEQVSEIMHKAGIRDGAESPTVEEFDRFADALPEPKEGGA